MKKCHILKKTEYLPYIKLAAIILLAWSFFYLLTPFLVEKSPIHQTFAEIQDRYAIPTGALYYNDIPFVRDAETHLRDKEKFHHAQSNTLKENDKRK